MACNGEHTYGITEVNQHKPRIAKSLCLNFTYKSPSKP